MKTDEFDSIIFDCDGVLIDVTEVIRCNDKQNYFLCVKGNSRHYRRYATNE